MVDITQLPDAAALMSELQRIDTAIDHLDNGGRILTITISPGEQPTAEDQPSTMPVTVETTTNEYLNQLAGEIRSTLSARRDEVNSMLSEMGVGGVDSQPRKAKKGK